MKIISKSIKKHLNFSNFWVRNGLILVIISVLANHLFEPKNFPLNEDYKFPLSAIVVSIIAGGLIILIVHFNFSYFKDKYFVKKINTQILLRFMLSTLGYVTILYIALYLGLNGWINGIESYSLYNLLSGLSPSLLISTIAIALFCSTDIYKLHKLDTIEGSIKVKHGGKISLVKYSEIAYVFNENKIVYIAKIDGTSISTDFTLNEVENKVSEQNFYRANRQTILHIRSIEKVASIENGKLSVLLKPTMVGKNRFEIKISRYKKQEFMYWFENKL